MRLVKAAKASPRAKFYSLCIGYIQVRLVVQKDADDGNDSKHRRSARCSLRREM